MKIKTQVSISLIVFVILAAVITSSYFSSTNQLQEIQKKQQIIDTIEKSSFELYYLENDYIVHGGTRTVERWNAKYALLTGQLLELTLTDPSQQAVLNSMLKSHADLQTTFSDFVAVTVSAQGKESISASQKVKDFAASTLTGHSQMMMSRSSELSQMVKTEAIDVEQRVFLIIISSLAALMVFVLLNYLLINRSVLRSISVLEKGAGRIGSGDLDTTIETGSNDELGDLSSAITAMASNLKTVLTSKSLLEKEVAERRRAEAALHSANEELTAIQEELRANLDELTRQELVLRESEGVLQSILDSTPAGVGLLVNRVLKKVNHSLCKITGYSEEEIIGQSSRMLYPDDEEYLRVGRKLYEQMEREGLGTVEARLKRKDGAIIIVMLSLSPFDPKNPKAGVTATALDITDRKRAEAQLLLKNMVFESSITANSIADNQGIITHVNPAFLRIWGYRTKEEAVGKAVSSFFVHEEDAAPVFEGLTTLGRWEGEFLAKRADGSTFIAQSIATVIRDENGKPVGYQSTILDITERKRTEEALRESEERYRDVVEDQTEFICRFLPDCTHIFVNDAYCRYFNRKREELIGSRFRPVLHPEDRETIERHLASLTPEHPVMDIDHQTIMPDGSTRWQRWSDRAIFGETGRVIEFQSVGRDITEQKELEKEREYHEQELTRFSTSLAVANKKLNLLSSITRHDINNQLTVLVGYLRILEKTQPDTSYAEYFQKINTSSQRISAMIRFTKEYEKIGVNAPSWQECRTLVDTAAKGAPLGHVMVKNDLPAGMTIFADPLITKVFYNLMDNAVRYGQKITTIRFSVQESGDDSLIVCDDDGDGVPVDEKEKIFERGFGKNTGLGLALSREILDITGITIKETGEPGKGARFEMTVPKGAWRNVGKGD